MSLIGPPVSPQPESGVSATRRQPVSAPRGAWPGQAASNGFGARARSVADLPDDFLRYTRELHPDMVEDPQAVLDTFEG